MPPEAEEEDEPEVDQNTSIQVYAPPILKGAAQTPIADVFFGYLKSILRDAGYEKQQEILIEKAEVYLLPSQTPPKPRR